MPGWTSLHLPAFVKSIPNALAWLTKKEPEPFTDGDNNSGGHWKRMPGGDTNRIVFQCAGHVQCPVKVKVQQGMLKFGNGPISFLHNGEQHAEEVQSKDRANARLSREEKAAADQAMQWRRSPQAMPKLQESWPSLPQEPA